MVNIKKLVLTISLPTIVVLGVLVYIGHNLIPPNYDPLRDKREYPRSEPSCVDRVKYEQLRSGMSVTEVRSILLCEGIEIERSATTATFVWSNPDGYKITVTFERDRLKSKRQSEPK